MRRQTHFEVHVLQSGQWSVHAQFDGSQKEAALEEGKSLSRQSGIGDVKVIREVYDPNEGSYEDYTIYRSSDSKAKTGRDYAKGEEPTGPASYDAYDDGDYADFDYDEGGGRGRKKKKKKGTKVTTILVKLLLVTLFSICLAALFTVMASSMLSGTTLFGVKIKGNAEANLLFVVFVGTFLVAATSMAMTFLKGESISDIDLDMDIDMPQRRRRAKPKPKPKKKVAKEPPKDEQAMAQEAREQIGAAMEGIEEFKVVDEEKAAEAEDINLRLQEAIGTAEQQGEAAAEEQPAEEQQPAEAQPTPEPKLSQHAEEQKAYMMTFLDQALKEVGSDQQTMDNFNKFGVNLFLAGACESVSEKRQLDVRSRSQVLADSVRVMGFKKSHAASFAERYEEYLMQDPRYMQMFQAGRNAMSTYFTDEHAGTQHLDRALEEWNKPKQKEEHAGPVTVLFTDIAGSTAMTQALGDAGAQEVVRAHNRIVREALTDCMGKEVKHTGDGIMASFNKTTDGIDASIQMQRQCEVHNQQHPNLPLHLKIGLNAGEPISEDNDLFGSTVQMSARIVDKAQADEIFVSEVVRGICAGKDYQFVNRGGFAMKGFEDDPILYEVVWRQSEAAE